MSKQKKQVGTFIKVVHELCDDCACKIEYESLTKEQAFDLIKSSDFGEILLEICDEIPADVESFKLRVFTGDELHLFVWTSGSKIKFESQNVYQEPGRETSFDGENYPTVVNVWWPGIEKPKSRQRGQARDRFSTWDSRTSPHKNFWY